MLNWLLALSFLLPLWPEISQADCDCHKACQSLAALEISSEVGFCSEADAKRCGVELDFSLQLKTKPKKNPNPRGIDPRNKQAEGFLAALHEEREVLQLLYADMIKPEEYAQLAALAYGLLGVESKYYRSERYIVKSWTPNKAINIARCLYRGNCTNPPVSEGPTQIKQIPTRIVDNYWATPSSLYRDETHAAVATMGFLIELKEDLYRLKKKYPVQMGGMNESNITDYLAYFYQGKGVRIIRDGEVPNVKSNPYLRELKEVHMADLQVKQMTCGPASLQFNSAPRAWGFR